MSTEPTEPTDNLVLHLLREMRAEIKEGFADVRSEMNTGFANVASDLIDMDAKNDNTKKELNERIEGLRKAVMTYHSTTIGHGVIVSELDMRLRRVEEMMGLTETH